MRWPWIKARASSPAHLRTGEWGERLAEQTLRAKGHRVLGRRVRVGKRDELDLVTRQDDVLVFVEVKTRASTQFGRPFTSVDRAKIGALSRAAVHYMKKLRQKPDYFRFDVVEVIGEEGSGEPSVIHIENAFQLSGKYRVPW